MNRSRTYSVAYALHVSSLSSPASNKHVFDCKPGEKVSEVLKKICDCHADIPTSTLGLYYKRVGIWLDQDREMASYEIPSGV
jgi:uncharacterized membrane protein